MIRFTRGPGRVNAIGRCAGTAALFFLVAAAAGCAPRTMAGTGRTASPTQVALPGPPPASTIPSYPLVKDDPGIAAASRNLDAGGEQARPGFLLIRAKEAIAAAQRIRIAQGNPIYITDWNQDHERYLAFYDLAYRDLEEIAVRYPTALEAPESCYLLGLIHDYPHLDLFEDALSRYRQAVALFPGTSWAAKAAERIEVIEQIMDGASGMPLGK